MQSNLDADFLGKLCRHKRFWITWIVRFTKIWRKYTILQNKRMWWPGVSENIGEEYRTTQMNLSQSI